VGTSKQDYISLPKLESSVRIVNLSTKQAVLEGERERESWVYATYRFRVAGASYTMNTT